MPPGIDNFINKFKSSTKQAADQMQRTAKVAKLKMDIMALQAERSKQMQTIGERTYNLYREVANIDGPALVDRIRQEIAQIERIDGRVKDMENQIAELQAVGANADIVDAAEVNDVSTSEQSGSQSENNQ